MTRQAIRSICALALLNLIGCTAGPVLADIERVTGIVSRVGASGNLLTITLGCGRENLKSGDRFAIFNSTEGYKGEATVIGIDGGFCFARLTVKQGKPVTTGDRCSTNLSRPGG